MDFVDDTITINIKYYNSIIIQKLVVCIYDHCAYKLLLLIHSKYNLRQLNNKNCYQMPSVIVL